MNTALVVPLHRQAGNWSEILPAVERQELTPTRVYVVLDRPGDEDVVVDGVTTHVDARTYVEEVNRRSPLRDRIQVIVAPFPSQIRLGQDLATAFLAGHVRNVGLEAASAEGMDVSILIDGDCVPERNLVRAHVQKASLPIPMLTIGRKVFSRHDWKDRRETSLSVARGTPFRPDGVLIAAGNWLTFALMVWSSNIGLNMSAMNRLRRLNGRYYGRQEVFSSEFLGRWGGEDAFLGVQALICHIFMHTIGTEASGVRHIDHPPHATRSAEDARTFFQAQMDRLHEKICDDPLTLGFFHPELAGGG